MTSTASYTQRRFYRRADNAMLGGVCAGFAAYFGCNLRVTRILAVIAFFVAMPMAIIAYLAVVFLVPTRSMGVAETVLDPELGTASRSTTRQTVHDVRSRCRSLDKRLANLEKYITSSRYNLDREFKDLEGA